MIQRLKNAIKTFAKICQHRPITAQIILVPPSEILKGKTVLVTGGTSGIGKAIATSFYQAGAHVILTSRTQQRAEQAAAEIDPSRTRVIGMAMDATDIKGMPERIEALKKTAPDQIIHILVNNAGLVGGGITNTTEEEFDRILSTNLKSVFFLSKMIAAEMVRNGIRGHILNIASSSSLRPAISAYTLSKWGIRGLTQGLAKMLAPHGIVVNGLAPGPTATPMLGKEDYSDIALPTNPIGRYALPEEIASMALFLCSSQGDTIVGDIVYMTGGAGVIENNDLDYRFEPGNQ